VADCIAQGGDEGACTEAGRLFFCTETQFCNRDLCESDPDRETACKDLVAFCVVEEPSANWDECFVFANVFICGADGGGGAGGSGGMGGTGGVGGVGGTGGAPPDPDILCDHEVCESDPDRKTACELLVAYCIADEPRSNWDECFAFALGFICGE
jgi:hypothetical protein